MSLQFYHGFTILQFLCPIVGLTLDQINFIFCCLLSIALGQYMRYCHCQSGANKRMTIEACLGLLLLGFCFGRQITLFLLEMALAYGLLRVLPSRYAGVVVTVVLLTFLSMAHLYRMHVDYLGYTMDITGPLMILTQKLCCLAFNLADGEKIRLGKHSELRENHARHAVLEFPSLLQYCAFTCYFHGIMAGPMVFYADYMQYIHLYGLSHLPDSNKQLCNTLCATLMHGLLTAVIAPQFPLSLVVTPDFARLPFTRRLLNSYVTFFLVRQKYYFAWSICEAGGLSAGLGYSGRNAQTGETEWRGVRNFQLHKIEAGQSLKDIVDGWNISTTWWLRETIYERAPTLYRTLLVFICSALWHGFYPGYYCMFLTFALFTFAARMVRRWLRPSILQLENDIVTFGYHIVTTIVASLAMNYGQAPFYFLMLETSLLFWKQYYFFLHAMAVGILLCAHVSPRLGDYRQKWMDMRMRLSQSNLINFF